MLGKHRVACVAAAALLTGTLVGCGGASGGDSQSGADGDASANAVDLTVYIDSNPSSLALWDRIIAKYKEVNPNVNLSYETHPAGGEGDNLVKTRLSTGDMSDMFWYNSGSLLQALSPDNTLVDLSDQPWVESVDENFIKSVATDSGIYGAPAGSSFAGVIIYNKTIYKDLGLEIPRTWDEFMANNQKIKDSGLTPVLQSYADTWTSQLFVLGDFYNVTAQDPEWAEKYTAGKVKYADAPAVEGFKHLEEIYKAGYLNDDFASANLDSAMRKLAEGEAAHYPMVTMNAAPVISENYPESDEEIGSFPIPGNDPEKNGATTWMPSGLYIPKTTEGEKLEAAKDFLNWFVSVEGCEVTAEAASVSGPFMVDKCEIPESAPTLVKDLQPYYDEGKVGLALEFISPIKGPALEQITVEVGSGIRGAQDGAALYDEDVKKQAQQLGIEGW